MQFQSFIVIAQKRKSKARALKWMTVFKSNICFLIYNVCNSIITTLHSMQVKNNQA